MSDKRAPSRKGHGGRRAPRRGGQDAPLLLVGWIFLGVVLVLAVAAIALQFPGRNAGEKPAAAPAATALPAGSSGGSAFVAETTAPPLTHAQGTGGRLVEVDRIRCDFTEPESISFGVLRGIDTSAMASALAANAESAGWGKMSWVYSDDGYLLLRAEEHPVLNGSDFEKQEAFLASAQPENLARTFMDNIGLIPLLKQYGITLTNYAENNDGMITFRGRGEDEQSVCTVQFSFLYTGAFNQAVFRGVYMDGDVTTDRVLSLKKAAQSAVTWSSAESGAVDVTGAELRSIRGLPFYVLTCSDDTVAYALAVPESELDAVAGARQVYEEMMRDGIQEYIEVPGAAY
ncbi:MAG: hypothetical protein IJH47_06070 [Oscillospiraceae bacterium]|nr:hypothetical protein [Oscillospiraceae bacterium]